MEYVIGKKEKKRKQKLLLPNRNIHWGIEIIYAKYEMKWIECVGFDTSITNIHQQSTILTLAEYGRPTNSLNGSDMFDWKRKQEANVYQITFEIFSKSLNDLNVLDALNARADGSLDIFIDLDEMES